MPVLKTQPDQPNKDTKIAEDTGLPPILGKKAPIERKSAKATLKNLMTKNHLQSHISQPKMPAQNQMNEVNGAKGEAIENTQTGIRQRNS